MVYCQCNAFFTVESWQNKIQSEQSLVNYIVKNAKEAARHFSTPLVEPKEKREALKARCEDMGKMARINSIRINMQMQWN